MDYLQHFILYCTDRSIRMIVVRTSWGGRVFWLVLWLTGIRRDIIWPCLSDDRPDRDHKRRRLCRLGIWCWASCPPDGSCNSVQDLLWGGEGGSSFKVCGGESPFFQGRFICRFLAPETSGTESWLNFKCFCLCIFFIKGSSVVLLRAFNVLQQQLFQNICHLWLATMDSLGSSAGAVRVRVSYEDSQAWLLAAVPLVGTYLFSSTTNCRK